MFHRFCQLSVSWLVTNDVFYPDFLLAKFARSFNLTLSWFLDHFSFHISIFHTSIFWHFHITISIFHTSGKVCQQFQLELILDNFSVSVKLSHFLLYNTNITSVSLNLTYTDKLSYLWSVSLTLNFKLKTYKFNKTRLEETFVLLWLLLEMFNTSNGGTLMKIFKVSFSSML